MLVEGGVVLVATTRVRVSACVVFIVPGIRDNDCGCWCCDIGGESVRLPTKLSAPVRLVCGTRR